MYIYVHICIYAKHFSGNMSKVHHWSETQYWYLAINFFSPLKKSQQKSKPSYLKLKFKWILEFSLETPHLDASTVVFEYVHWVSNWFTLANEGTLSNLHENQSWSIKVVTGWIQWSEPSNHRSLRSRNRSGITL